LKVLTVFGTRPEAIKMAPLVLALQADESFESVLCVTGQDLTDVITAFLQKMRDVLAEIRPDIMLVHGDTATNFAVTLTAYYEQISVVFRRRRLRLVSRYWLCGRPPSARRQ